MSLKKSKAVYDLIHSLSANEKRFFKIYASRHQIGGKNNYVKLFEVFDKFKDYDEAKILKTIQEETFVKHFSVERNYLYQILLECLDVYHKDSSVDKQISKLTNIARVLANKKLDEQSAKVLQKALDLAEYHNRFESLLPIFRLQKQKDFSNDTITKAGLSDYYTRIDKAIKGIESTWSCQKVFDELMLLRRRKGSLITKETMAEAKNIYPNVDEPEPEVFYSFAEEVYFLLMRMEYYRLNPFQNSADNYASRLITLFESNRRRIRGGFIDHYIYALNVFLVQRLYDNQEKAREVLDKLNRIDEFVEKKEVNTYVKAKVSEVYYTALTDLAIHTKDYSEILKNKELIYREIKVYEGHMTPSFNLVLKSNLACVFFAAEKYKDALFWCHQIVNEAPVLREDVYHVMRILYLLVHFELGNKVILPSLIRSTNRYLGKGKETFQLEAILIKYLSQLIDLYGRKEKRELFSALKLELMPLRDNPFENIALRDIDILGWVDKKIP